MNNQETLSAERGADSAAPCSAEPPRCTDCKWMTRDDRNGKPLCKRPGVGEKSVVNGAMLYPSCADQREDHDWLMNLFLGKSCGVAAKYFQPNTVLTALPDDQSKPPTT